jgi:hypothetical protein
MFLSLTSPNFFFISTLGKAAKKQAQTPNQIYGSEALAEPSEGARCC